MANGSALKFSDLQSSAEVLDRLIETVIKQPEKPKWSFTQWALLAVLIIIVGTWMLGLYFNIFGKEIKSIEMSNTHIVGSSELCPGEILTIVFNLHADGTGKLVEDATVWREFPTPKTVIYSETRPLLVDGLLEQEQPVAWRVPKSFIDPSDLQEIPLPPGEYRRIFSISSATDENVFALDRVTFSIRNDCSEKIP